MYASVTAFKNAAAAAVVGDEEAKEEAEKKKNEKLKVMRTRISTLLRLHHRFVALGHYVALHRLYREGEHPDSKVCVCVCVWVGGCLQ